MANKVLHKKSNSVVGGVPSMPQPSQLEYGEIAINYSDGNEAIVIKNDSNEIVSFPTYEKVQSLRSFVEGSVPTAIISASGNNTASSQYSFAVGLANAATGNTSFAEGNLTRAYGDVSHAEGQETTAATAFSHAEGLHTITSNQAEHAQGRYNVSHSGNSVSAQTIHSVGIGTSSSDTKNAFEIMGDGGIYVYGVGNYSGSTLASADTLQTYLEKNEFVIATALNELNDDLGELSQSVSTIGESLNNFPCASTSTYGIVKVGDFLSASGGVLSVATGTTSATVARGDHDHGTASTSSYGVMKVGNFLTVNNGVVSVDVGNDATTVAPGNHTHTAQEIGAASSAHTHEIGDIPAQTTLTSVDTEVPTGKAVIDYIDELIVSPVNYKGARTTGTLPASGDTKVGDLYIVQASAISLTSAESATGAAQTAETGDYVIARTRSTWDVVEKNLTGAVTSTANLTTDMFVLGDGNQTIKQSTYGPSSFATAAQGTKADGAVRFDASQSLTDAQKTQARNNIGAVSENGVQGYYSNEPVTPKEGDIVDKADVVASDAIVKDEQCDAPTSDYKLKISLPHSYTYPGNWSEVTIEIPGFGASSWDFMCKLHTVDGGYSVQILDASNNIIGVISEDAPAFVDVPFRIVGAAMGKAIRITESTGASYSTYSILQFQWAIQGYIKEYINGSWEERKPAPDVSGKEDTANKVTSLSSASTDTQYPSAKAVYDALVDNEFVVASALNDLNDNKEDTSNKVTTISSNATDTQYPSARAVYSYVQNNVGGNSLTGITVDGVAAPVSSGVAAVSLATATTSAYGQVRVGDFINVSNGIISVATGTSNTTVARGDHSHALPTATTSSQGIMQVGSFLSVSNGTVSVSTGTTSATVARGDHSHTGMESTSNKVTSLSSGSTNTQYPGAKLVYDELQGVVHKTGIETINGAKTVHGDGWNFSDTFVDFTDGTYARALQRSDFTWIQIGDGNNGTTSLQAVLNAHNNNSAIHLPTVTAADNGKILQVVNGAWAVVNPVTVYSGASAPNNNLGIDGDIYIQTD